MIIRKRLFKLLTLIFSLSIFLTSACDDGDPKAPDFESECATTEDCDLGLQCIDV